MSPHVHAPLFGVAASTSGVPQPDDTTQPAESPNPAREETPPTSNTRRYAFDRRDGWEEAGVKSKFLKTLWERGFLDNVTDVAGLDKALCEGEANGKGVTAYIGFDATAPSLHVGSLVQIMMLYWLQKTGHRPIVLMGGGTTMVGDPSGRTTERGILSPQDIQKNIDGIRQVFGNVLQFAPETPDDPATTSVSSTTDKEPKPSDALLLNNADWLAPLQYLPFLRNIGRYFSVNRMLSQDSVSSRLNRSQSLSFLEFNYMVLQAYDFLELNRRHGCTLQLGGSDQWGNIVMGIDLVRRVEQREVFGITTPLITMSDGRKMGKTQSGAIWLDPDHLSDFEYWQYWRNISDDDVIRFLLLFTDLPIEAIDDFANLRGSELNSLKFSLANSATDLVRGKGAFMRALIILYLSFEDQREVITQWVNNEKITEKAGIKPKTLDALKMIGRYLDWKQGEPVSPPVTDEEYSSAITIVAFHLPDVRVALSGLRSTAASSLRADNIAEVAKIDVASVFVAAGLVPSKSEFRRLVKDNGVKINLTPIVDANALLGDVLTPLPLWFPVGAPTSNPLILSVGKKKHVAVVVDYHA